MEPSEISSLIRRFGVGARSSMAVTHAGTGYFACTPEAPYDASLSTAEQARQLFAKAEARLAASGSGKDKLLFVAIMLRDIADVHAFNEVWDAWIADVEPPARACFQAQLANPALKVETIMVYAAPAS